MCHAVLEWLSYPRQALEALTAFLVPGGILSLMFYNKNATILKSIMRGNFFKEGESFQFGRQKNLTPTHPLMPRDVYRWLANLDLKIISKTGVRIFYDYLNEDLKRPEDYQRILKNELTFCKDEPFVAIARYVHVASRKEW